MKFKFIRLVSFFLLFTFSFHQISFAYPITSTAVQEVGPSIGLSPNLTQTLSVATSALSGTIAQGSFDPNTTVFQALKNAAPRLALNFAQVGITALGDLTGLDPGISGVVSSIGSSVIGRLTGSLLNSNGGGGPGSIFNSIKNSLLDSQTLGGLVSVGASIGLDAVDAPSIFQDFMPNILEQLAGGSGNSLFRSITDNLAKFGQGVLNVAGSIISFGSTIRCQALLKGTDKKEGRHG